MPITTTTALVRSSLWTTILFSSWPVAAAASTRLRVFTSTAAGWKASNPPRPTVEESEIEESFLKGRCVADLFLDWPERKVGWRTNGCMNLEEDKVVLVGKRNKTSSAVQLRHIPTGIVVKSQETRSHIQNRKIARRILAEKLDFLANGEDSRQAIVAEKVKKKKASKKKKSKRKYAKLDADGKSIAGTIEFRKNNEEDRQEVDDEEEEEDDVATEAKRVVGADKDFSQKNSV